MPQQEYQPYDNALKALMAGHAAEMLPELVTGTSFREELNPEIKRDALRPDLVYLVEYRQKAHVLNMELQSNTDQDIVSRLLRYHTELHDSYHLPVLSVILYLFNSKVPIPPYEEEGGDGILLTFHYTTVKLWILDAQKCLEQGIIPMYTLLPAMKGANTYILIQAIHRMAQHYNRLDLARHLTRFKRILQRSATLSSQDKQEVLQQMQPYDSLIDDNPDVQERVTLGELRGEQRGEQRGELYMAQKVVLDAINNRYPSLVSYAQQQVPRIRKTDELLKLVPLIYTAPDQQTVSLLLDKFAA